MLRRHFKQREAFRKTASAHIKQLNAALDLAVAAMDKPWSDLEHGWLVHQQHLVELGVRPTTGNEGVLRLNVGGVPANVHRSLLAEAEGFEGSILGALFDQMWDRRVPRDADGRIVLDESPVCVKHIIHVLLKGGSSKQAGAVPTDEEAYLLYISHVLGLSDVIPASPTTQGMTITGGTTIASPLQLSRWSSTLQEWCPGHPVGLSLLYRASRDGFRTAPFQTRVRGVLETITLIRVQSGSRLGDSVVGGYADIELVPRELGAETENRPSKLAFLFLLESPNETGGSHPAEKWSIKEGFNDCAVQWPDTTDDCAGPAFGLDDMVVTFGQHKSESADCACTLSTRGEFYNVNRRSPFLDLDGHTVTEIEVFRVEGESHARQQPAPVATVPPGTTSKPLGRRLPYCQGTSRDELEDKYTQKFGSSLAELLMEEQMALEYAQAELREAEVRAAATARALATVYGPNVARGEEDPVFELSVRGISVTTLRSTLKACPKSVFRALLLDERVESDRSESNGGNEDRNGGGGGLVDEDGRRKVDCDPSCFSKIMDVVRMRKRAAWAAREELDRRGEGATGGCWGVGGQTIRIPIPENDRWCFKEAVHTLFPSCEEFIMGLVEPWEGNLPRVFISPPLPDAANRAVSGQECKGLRGNQHEGGAARGHTRRAASADQLVGSKESHVRRPSLVSTTVQGNIRSKSAAAASASSRQS